MKLGLSLQGENMDRVYSIKGWARGYFDFTEGEVTGEQSKTRYWRFYLIVITALSVLMCEMKYLHRILVRNSKELTCKADEHKDGQY
jgi:hypothetical protein